MIALVNQVRLATIGQVRLQPLYKCFIEIDLISFKLIFKELLILVIFCRDSP